MTRLRKFLRVSAVCLIGLILIAAAPILFIETSCKARIAPHEEHAQAFVIDDPHYRRAEGDSYLTYPEWYIVQAYADLADVTRQSSESSFDYLASITGFWRSLCSATRTASAIGPVTLDQRVTDYIIGLSFSAEMGLQGLYERTIGRLSVATRGETKTPEDEFNLRFLEDYAAFLQQTPWYAYPFKEELLRFWKEVPWTGQAPIREAERRFALSLEYGVKWGYGAAMSVLAGLSPADLRIQSIVRRANPDTGWPEGVTPLRELDDNATLIETARYQAFTELLRAFGKRGDSMLEIAGNHRILTTVIAPDGLVLDTPGAQKIFAVPIQSKPGWQRVGLETDVSAVTMLIGAIERQGAGFEHAYDY